MAQYLGSTPLFSLPGATTVLTYETDASTTEQATYHDTDLTIKRANPITLSNTGEAEVYLETDTQYRFVIKDADDSTLHTIDNISPIVEPGALRSNLDVGTSSIVSTSAGDITITPTAGTNLVLDGLYWPDADGATDFIIATDGSANLSWIPNAARWSLDTTPQLGGDLDTNSFNIKIDSAHGLHDDSDNEQLTFTTTTGAVNYLDVTNEATGSGPTMAAAGADTDIDFNINPKGLGNVVISGLEYPKNDGSNGHLMITDGTGNVTFQQYVGDSAPRTNLQVASGTNPVAAVDLEYAALMPAAVAKIESGVLVQAYNVSSIEHIEYGPQYQYTLVHFDVPMNSSNYVVLCSEPTFASGNSWYLTYFTTADYINMRRRDLSPVDSYKINDASIIVYGLQDLN